MDTPAPFAADERYERIVRTAMRLLQVPAAFVALVADEGPVLRAAQGLPEDDARHVLAFCDRQLLGEQVLMVSDASINPLFASNPLVTGRAQIRSYLAAPMARAPGVPTGVVGALHTEPRAFRHGDIAALQDLARMAEAEFKFDALNVMHKRVLARVSQLEQRLHAARNEARRTTA
jgi:GAF domain-containing protein